MPWRARLRENFIVLPKICSRWEFWVGVVFFGACFGVGIGMLTTDGPRGIPPAACLFVLGFASLAYLKSVAKKKAAK